MKSRHQCSGQSWCTAGVYKRSVNGELVEIRPDGWFAVNHDGFLTITDIQLSDSGLYLVSISNSQGSALHTVWLQVTRSIISTQCMHAQNLIAKADNGMYDLVHIAYILLIDKNIHLCCMKPYNIKVPQCQQRYILHCSKCGSAIILYQLWQTRCCSSLHRLRQLVVDKPNLHTTY